MHPLSPAPRTASSPESGARSCPGGKGNKAGRAVLDCSLLQGVFRSWRPGPFPQQGLAGWELPSLNTGPAGSHLGSCGSVWEGTLGGESFPNQQRPDLESSLAIKHTHTELATGCCGAQTFRPLFFPFPYGRI